MQGAAGYILDRALWVFGSEVESKVSEASRNATNEMFARSASDRAFARAMGDDMDNSTAGFAKPEVGSVGAHGNRSADDQGSTEVIISAF